MMRDFIKSWWESLAEREKKMIVAGGLFLAIFLFYTVVWNPLSGSVSILQSQINQDREVLQYLEKGSLKIDNYRLQGISAVVNSSNQDILSIVEETLSKAQLSTYLKQVQQPQKNQIQLTFENVPLDQWMGWLQQCLSSQGMVIVSLQATRSTAPGTAMISVLLMR